MKYKICKKCGKSKPTTEFYKCKTNKDGLHGSCKVCQNLYHDNYIIEKREEDLDSYLETKRKQSSNFAQNNPDKIKEYKKNRLINQICNILKDHADDLNNDSERLHSDFILNIIESCKGVKNNGI